MIMETDKSKMVETQEVSQLESQLESEGCHRPGKTSLAAIVLLRSALLLGRQCLYSGLHPIE